MTSAVAAASWAARGFRVFRCAPGSKRPAAEVSSWLEEATSDTAKVFERWGDADYNIGVDCSAYVVIDVDEGKHPGALDSYLALDTPPTLCVETPSGGYHFYFQGPPVANSVSKIAKGIDVRSFHGYVLAPGSAVNGKAYRVKEDLGIADLPEHVRQAAGAAREASEKGTVDWTAEVDTARLAAGLLALQDMPAATQGQGGDQLTFATAARLRDIGLNAATTLQALLVGWNDRCDPPWSPDELRTKVENAYSYAQNKAGVSSAEHAFGDAVLASEGWELLHSYDVADEELPPLAWVVPGVIPKNQVTLLTGAGGTGKTRIAMQLAAAVARGGSWLGLPVETQGAVMALLAENDPVEAKRVLQIAMSGERLKGVYVKAGAGEDVQLVRFDKNGGMILTGVWDNLVAAVGKLRPAVVLLDNLMHVFGGEDVNKNQAVSFIRQLRKLCNDFDTSVLLLSHPSLRGENDGDGQAGSMAWSDSVRARLYLSHDKTAEGGVQDYNARVLELMKANNAPRGMKLNLTFDPVSQLYAVRDPAVSTAARRQDLGNRVAAYFYADHTASLEAIDVAKRLVADRDIDAVALLEKDGNYNGVKAHLLRELASGVRLADGSLLCPDGNALVLR